MMECVCGGERHPGQGKRAFTRVKGKTKLAFGDVDVVLEWKELSSPG